MRWYANESLPNCPSVPKYAAVRKCAIALHCTLCNSIVLRWYTGTGLPESSDASESNQAFDCQDAHEQVQCWELRCMYNDHVDWDVCRENCRNDYDVDVQWWWWWWWWKWWLVGSEDVLCRCTCVLADAALRCSWGFREYSRDIGWFFCFVSADCGIVFVHWLFEANDDDDENALKRSDLSASMWTHCDKQRNGNRTL